MLFSKPLIVAGVAVVMAYNIVSIGLSYRAGQNAVRREQMEALAKGLHDAVEKYTEQLRAYQYLAVQFSENHERTQAQMRKTEESLNEYLKTIDSKRPCLDDNGVSLLNQHIRPGRGTKTAPAAGRSERPAPLRRPAVTQ